MNNVVLLLGTNVGDRLINLEKAWKEIQNTLGKVIRYSSVYETAPWGNSQQQNFLNQVILIESTSSAEVIMKKIIDIEENMGRIRKKKWEPRIIDIDILFFNKEIISHHDLEIPHPRIRERKFTMVPLAELIPEFIHPVFKKSIIELLKELNDPLDVKKISNHLA